MLSMSIGSKPSLVRSANLHTWVAIYASIPIKEGRMSIISTAFGRVKLTEADAAKFKRQVTYGRPKSAAKVAVLEGVALSKSLGEQGSIQLRLSKSA